MGQILILAAIQVTLLAALFSLLSPPPGADVLLKTRSAGFTRLVLGVSQGDERLRLDLTKPERFLCQPPKSSVLEEAAAAVGVRNVIVFTVIAFAGGLVLALVLATLVPSRAAEPPARREMPRPVRHRRRRLHRRSVHR